MTDYKEQVSNLLDQTSVKAAVDAALAQVKAAPKDEDARRLLIDLLIVDGDFERADRQADILANTAGALTLGMVLLRGRLRAAKAREAWFTLGAVPAFPEGPTARDQQAMQLGVALRGGGADIAKALQDMTRISESQSLVINGAPAAGFRDADDRVPHAFEVLCSDGSYMWVDFDLVERVDFSPAGAVRDLIWRPAKLTLTNGSQTDVVICATYFSAAQDDSEKLARSTGWIEMPGGVVAGQGQKTFLAGDDAVCALDIASVARTV
jgi:type VI secretion system protein ImpE